MYVGRFLLLFLSISVLSSPLFQLDDTQPQLGASLTLLGSSACPPLPENGVLPSINVTQAGSVTIASQTTYASATQTEILPAMNSSASIVAPPSIGVSEQICIKMNGQTLSNYNLPTYDFLPALLSPSANRYFAFKFVRTGGHFLHIMISGLPLSSPDRPGSYSLLANEAFLEGNLENVVWFRITQPMLVKVHLRLGAGSTPFSYQFELFQIDRMS